MPLWRKACPGGAPYQGRQSGASGKSPAKALRLNSPHSRTPRERAHCGRNRGPRARAAPLVFDATVTPPRPSATSGSILRSAGPDLTRRLFDGYEDQPRRLHFLRCVRSRVPDQLDQRRPGVLCDQRRHLQRVRRLPEVRRHLPDGSHFEGLRLFGSRDRQPLMAPVPVRPPPDRQPDRP